MLTVIGLKLEIDGIDNVRPGAVVANHSSWLDIFVLYAATPGQFVAKSEVKRWPGIGVLGRLFGTIFIERDRRQAKHHLNQLQVPLERGERLIFFPEGTSSDGQRILSFRTTLFEVFFATSIYPIAYIQPVFIQYLPDEGSDPRIYTLHSGMKFGRHMLSVLAHGRRGTVAVTIGNTVKVSDYGSRKTLARSLERSVRSLAPQPLASRSA
ncbi:MAG: lysophospholipid acyltransferase family protein [Pseudomonadota bacterium]